MAKVGPSPSTETATSFWSLVLADMGAPITQSNIEALNAWSQREGGGGAYNPLNTTRPEPGSTFFNHLSGNTGVQNYNSPEQGAQATADSINNGLYPSIVSAFKGGNAFGALVSGGKGPVGAQLRKWSGGGYNNVMGTGGAYVSPTFGKGATVGSGVPPAKTKAAPTGNPATNAGGCQSLGDAIAQQGSAPIIGGIPGEAQISGFFYWIVQGCVQKRLVIQGAGLVMIFYGLKFMGHDKAVNIVTAPVSAGKDLLKGAMV